MFLSSLIENYAQKKKTIKQVVPLILNTSIVQKVIAKITLANSHFISHLKLKFSNVPFRVEFEVALKNGLLHNFLNVFYSNCLQKSTFTIIFNNKIMVK